MRNGYRCEAITLEGFIQQLAIAYVARGYFFYVAGWVPQRLDAAEHDERMLAKFDVAHSKHARYRRRRRCDESGQPLANTQYLRHRDFWVLLATPGSHQFFQEHQASDQQGLILTRQYRDVRRQPVVYGGYSVSHRRGRVSVRISPKAYRELRDYYLAIALTASGEQLASEFERFPFESYGGVNNQMQAIRRAVNRRRKTAGLPPAPRDAIRSRRKQLRPFGESRSGHQTKEVNHARNQANSTAA